MKKILIRILVTKKICLSLVYILVDFNKSDFNNKTDNLF